MPGEIHIEPAYFKHFESMTVDTSKPDFPEWIKSKDGIECANLSNLKEQKYLENRLFWAFDAGRNRIWDQYLNEKKKFESKEKELFNFKALVKQMREKEEKYEATYGKNRVVRKREYMIVKQQVDKILGL